MNRKSDLVNKCTRFNSQPPEGGWPIRRFDECRRVGFNSQPPEGGWQGTGRGRAEHLRVSTHSRPKAAGNKPRCRHDFRQRFNSQPPEGGWACGSHRNSNINSFNSQPPEGGWDKQRGGQIAAQSFNSQPPEGGWMVHD